MKLVSFHERNTEDYRMSKPNRILALLDIFGNGDRLNHPLEQDECKRVSEYYTLLWNAPFHATPEEGLVKTRWILG